MGSKLEIFNRKLMKKNFRFIAPRDKEVQTWDYILIKKYRFHTVKIGLKKIVQRYTGTIVWGIIVIDWYVMIE